VAQLEAEIAQLKDALARRQQIGVATGLVAQRFGPSPRAGLVTTGASRPKTAMSSTQHRFGRDQRARQSTQPSRGRNTRAIEMHMPDGVRLIGARVDGQQPTCESSQ
jgi:hypothetical protein